MKIKFSCVIKNLYFQVALLCFFCTTLHIQSIPIGAIYPGSKQNGDRITKQPEDFQIVIQREVKETRNNKDPKYRIGPWEAILGTISVNGEEIGSTVENADLKIAAGTYKGLIRYWSKKGFAQGPFGTYGHEGDFLLEISNVGKRSNLLFHGGTQPWHSEGCILLGPVNKDKAGTRFLNSETPLVKLRQLFYGTDVPDSTPDKNITITIIDISESKGIAENPNAKCIPEKCKKYKTLFRNLKSYEEQVLKPCEVLKAGSQEYLSCMTTANKKYEERQKELDAIFEGDENGLLDCSESADDAPACDKSN